MLKRNPEKLHRIKNNSNDWDDIPDDRLNPHQRLAKKTRGIATAANAVTLSGTIIVLDGLMSITSGQKLRGFIEIIVGRSADIADGMIADATDTKSKLGRDFDAGVDGVQLVAAAVVLAHNDIVPAVAAGVMVAQKGADTLGTIAGKINHNEINPTGEAKAGMALLWGGISSFVLAATVERHIPGWTETVLEGIGWAGTMGGAAVKAPATIEYLQVGFGMTEQASSPTDPPA